MKAYDVIVFDFDGVILESVDAKTEAFRSIGNLFSPKAGEGLATYHMENGGVSRFLKFEWLFKEILKKPLTEEELQRLGEEYSKLCLEKVKAAPFVRGAEEILNALYQNADLYVASGTPQKELEEIIAHRNLGHFFKGVYGSPPGKTEILEKIVEETKALPARVLMIGDSNTDYKAAREVGTMFYGRGLAFESTGYPFGEDLKGLADFLVRYDVLELISIISEFDEEDEESEGAGTGPIN